MNQYIKSLSVIGGLTLSGLFFYVLVTVEMPFLCQFFMVAFGLLSARHSFRKFNEKARIMTRPKSNTLDPQGVVVKSNLERSLGIKYLKKVSVGRYIEIQLEEGEEEDVKKNVQEAIDKLLYNEIIEDYEVMYE